MLLSEDEGCWTVLGRARAHVTLKAVVGRQGNKGLGEPKQREVVSPATSPSTVGVEEQLEGLLLAQNAVSSKDFRASEQGPGPKHDGGTCSASRRRTARLIRERKEPPFGRGFLVASNRNLWRSTQRLKARVSDVSETPQELTFRAAWLDSGLPFSRALLAANAAT